MLLHNVHRHQTRLSSCWAVKAADPQRGAAENSTFAFDEAAESSLAHTSWLKDACLVKNFTKEAWKIQWAAKCYVSLPSNHIRVILTIVRKLFGFWSALISPQTQTQSGQDGQVKKNWNQNRPKKKKKNMLQKCIPLQNAKFSFNYITVGKNNSILPLIRKMLLMYQWTQLYFVMF